MIQSFIVYTLLTLVMLVFGKASADSGKWNYVVYACVAYSIVFGFRYFVGFDWMSYAEAYKDALNYGTFWQEEIWEKGFVILLFSLAKIGAPLFIFMGITSFVSVFGTFQNLRENLYIIPFSILAFMLTCYWLNYSNGIRQVLAEAFWLWSIRYIVSKEIVKHYILIVLAILMHNSAWLLLIAYPLFNNSKISKEWFSNINIQLLLLLLSIALMNFPLLQNFLREVEYVLNLSGYDYYLDSDDSEILNKEQIQIGLGFAINLGRAMIIILYSNKVKEWVNNDLFVIVYDLYFIGLIVSYAFMNSHLIIRENGYLACTSIIIGGYLLAYLYYNERNRFYPIFISCFVLTFIAVVLKGLENSATFVFLGQEDLYYLKNNLIQNLN